MILKQFQREIIITLKNSSHLEWRVGLSDTILKGTQGPSMPGLDLHRCFLPSLAPFGQAVSEEKIFFNISQSEKRIHLGGHVCWPNGTK
jgi:hypothetical protein